MSQKIVIIGAKGAISKHLIAFLQQREDIELTLFARDTTGLIASERVHIEQGDALDRRDLDRIIKGKDLVYVNLIGPMDQFAKHIVESMLSNKVNRLIFITSLGIYKEVAGKFGQWNEAIIGQDLIPYAKAAHIIEESKLDYTEVRPSWLTDKDEDSYETTQKGELFTGTEVSRKAVAKYVLSLVEDNQKDIRASVGVHKPGVYGDKPSFM